MLPKPKKIRWIEPYAWEPIIVVESQLYSDFSRRDFTEWDVLLKQYRDILLQDRSNEVAFRRGMKVVTDLLANTIYVCECDAAILLIDLMIPHVYPCDRLARLPHGASFGHMLCAYSSIALVRKLHEAGFRLDRTDASGHTPLLRVACTFTQGQYSQRHLIRVHLWDPVSATFQSVYSKNTLTLANTYAILTSHRSPLSLLGVTKVSALPVIQAITATGQVCLDDTIGRCLSYVTDRCVNMDLLTTLGGFIHGTDLAYFLAQVAWKFYLEWEWWTTYTIRVPLITQCPRLISSLTGVRPAIAEYEAPPDWLPDVLLNGQQVPTLMVLMAGAGNAASIKCSAVGCLEGLPEATRQLASTYPRMLHDAALHVWPEGTLEVVPVAVYGRDPENHYRTPLHVWAIGTAKRCQFETNADYIRSQLSQYELIQAAFLAAGHSNTILDSTGQQPSDYLRHLIPVHPPRPRKIPSLARLALMALPEYDVEEVEDRYFSSLGNYELYCSPEPLADPLRIWMDH